MATNQGQFRVESEHIYQNLSVSKDNLELGKLIARGASCEVYRGKLTTPDGIKDVAVKTLLKYEIDDEDRDEGIPEEIIFLKSLEHRNIVQFVGMVMVPGEPIRIVTELAAKGSLYGYLKKIRSNSGDDSRRLPSKLFIIWTMDAVYAIQFLQRMNVAHRDIKSMNFVITDEDVLKLCDFGIAKNMEATIEMAIAVGTVHWMAPEIFKNRVFSFASDVYSFGIMVWEMYTCEEPYRGMNSMQIMWAVGNDGTRPEIPADCPGNIRDLLVRCWQGDRKLRPKIDEVVKCLEDVYHYRERGKCWRILYLRPSKYKNMFHVWVLGNRRKRAFSIFIGKQT